MHGELKIEVLPDDLQKLVRKSIRGGIDGTGLRSNNIRS